MRAFLVVLALAGCVPATPSASDDPAVEFFRALSFSDLAASLRFARNVADGCSQVQVNRGLERQVQGLIRGAMERELSAAPPGTTIEFRPFDPTVPNSEANRFDVLYGDWDAATTCGIAEREMNARTPAGRLLQ